MQHLLSRSNKRKRKHDAENSKEIPLAKQIKLEEEKRNSERETISKWYRSFIVGALGTSIPLLDVLQVIYDYLPQLFVRAYSNSIDGSGRYVVSLNHNPIRWNKSARSAWHTTLASVLSTHYGHICLFYNPTPSQTFVLFTTDEFKGSQQDIYISNSGSLMSSHYSFRHVVRKLVRLPSHVHRITCTEVRDNVFGSLWIQYVNCHGIGRYLQYRWTLGGIIAQPETSNHNRSFIRELWAHRQKIRGCTLLTDCDCAISEDYYEAYHHFCEETGNSDGDSNESCWCTSSGCPCWCPCTGCAHDDKKEHQCTDKHMRLCPRETQLFHDAEKKLQQEEDEQKATAENDQKMKAKDDKKE
jgi:hypothetical protein